MKIRDGSHSDKNSNDLLHLMENISDKLNGELISHESI